MRRYWFAAVAVVGAALLGAMPAAAASPVLTTGSVGGTPVAVNDVLTGSLASGATANFNDTSSNGVNVTCNSSSFSAKVTSNPSSPGTAGESLTNQSFSNCSVNQFATTIDSISVDNTPFNATVTSSGAVTISAGSAGPIQTTVNVNNAFIGSFSCVYRVHASSGSISGTASNSDNSLSFTNQTFDLFNGPSTCVSQANFTAKYIPVTDSTQSGSPKVFTQ